MYISLVLSGISPYGILRRDFFQNTKQKRLNQLQFQKNAYNKTLKFAASMDYRM